MTIALDKVTSLYDGAKTNLPNANESLLLADVRLCTGSNSQVPPNV